MISQQFRFVCLAGAVLLVLAGCERPEIRSAPLTVNELAAAMGVSSLCAETRFASACYARLVAVTTDATGKHRKEISSRSAGKKFRLCVLLFHDSKSGSFHSLTYSIYALDGGGGGGQGYIQIEPGSSFQQSKTENSGEFSYDLTFQKGTETTNIRIDLETSATPFPEGPPARIP